ncbi:MULTISPECIES: ABC transporter substrate-binding protein [Bacillus]|uniref:Sugar ABC transporter substrate-binding protein n=1 Tax=Bacillus infantis NRRL B-14911 TaxID=1367477 RepID=U5LID5_9BACI|nr:MULTISPECIES: sugar ABC transporter substrate-binding protein [Bacillus]AGX06451.1 sugar ABC transporter substrate-binding protein [Bacillus infantis NRRL B-14911]EAR68621.1 Sugar-binding periplasmic proteins/domains [Bacillus sp. NRRL B-14911]MCA1033510.1 sugar ABC transporter substrate-binding protein [Bacillus infantis]
MKKVFKMISMSLLAAVLLISVTACSDSSSSNGSGGSKDKKVTLDYLWFTDGVEGDVMRDIIKDYQSENENVEINLIEVAYADFNTKLKTMIAGGKPPALARVTDTGIFAEQALDLTEYVGGAEEFTSQFLPSIKPYYVKDDKIIATPMDVTANGLIYNKTLFEKAGVEVPQSPDDVWTWDEFADAIQEVKEKGGAKYGLLVDFTPHRYSTMVYEFGGSIFTEDLSAPAINNENGVAALDNFIKLHKDEVIPESVWLGGENPNNLFRSGTAAAHLAGNWMLSNYKDIENFDWGVTYLPKAEIRSSVPGGKYIMGFKNTGLEDETAEFIKYLSSQEVNAKFNQESLFLSARKDNNELDYEFGKEMFKVFSNELENTPEAAANDWGNQVVISKVTTDMRDAVVEALSGGISSQEAMDKVAELLEEAIADQE